MMEAREIGRLGMNVASNVAGSIVDHNLKSMRLSDDMLLMSFEYITQLAGAKTGRDVIELSSAHCRNQLNVMSCYTSNLLDLVCKLPRVVAEPVRTRAVVASCVIL